MTPGDVINLLTLAAAYDQRTVGEADVAAWHQALFKLDKDEAEAAVIDYYQKNRERIMPADVWNRCRTPASRSPAAEVLPPRQAGADPARWQGMWRGALAGAQAANAARRDLVLGQPEVAARLCDPPLGYAHPGQWSGFVPPELWGGARNDAPERAALLAIVEAARAALDDAG